MKNKQIISILKIVSVVLFLMIAQCGPHVCILFGFFLINIFYKNFGNGITLEDVVLVLNLLGVILILISIRFKKYQLTIIGYSLNYIMLFGSFFVGNVFDKPENNTYFFVTSGVYFILSIIVILTSIKRIKKPIS